MTPHESGHHRPYTRLLTEQQPQARTYGHRRPSGRPPIQRRPLGDLQPAPPLDAACPGWAPLSSGQETREHGNLYSWLFRHPLRRQDHANGRTSGPPPRQPHAGRPPAWPAPLVSPLGQLRRTRESASGKPPTGPPQFREPRQDRPELRIRHPSRTPRHATAVRTRASASSPTSHADAGLSSRQHRTSR